MSLVADYSDSEDENRNDEVSDESYQVQQSKSPSISNGASNSQTGHSKPEEINGDGNDDDDDERIGSNFLIPERGSDPSDSDGSEDEVDVNPFRSRKSKLIKLDNPFRSFGDVNVAKEDSVFRNPFRDKEDERQAVLEHHVKVAFFLCSM